MSTAVNTVRETLPWHAIPQNEVVQRLATSRQTGLEPAEVSVRLEKYGLNRLPQSRKRGPFGRFLSQFNNILIYILIAAGVTKLIMGVWVDACIIFCVVLLNALL
jgi:magnesium-transporting ATPase (P-type)